MNGTNILLVSSNSQYCQEAQQFFAQSNYELTVAKDRATALTLIEQCHFSFIICQLRSSCIDGFSVLEKLQNHQQTAQIPFILLGDHFHSQEHRQAMEMGADDILFLPYSFLDIEGIVATRLSKNSALLRESQKELEQLRYNITTYLPHEMRTALTGIIAASELLFQKYQTLDSFVMKEMLHCINTSGKKLSHLTHNFLLYSELKSLASDDLKIANLRKNYTFEVKEAIVNTIIQYSKQYSRQSDIIIELENACVQMAVANLTKLIGELVDNACKFSPCGTPIKISSKIEREEFVFAISNYSREVNSGQITKIDLDKQSDLATYNSPGFGLGLMISEDLAKLHGGNLLIDRTSDFQTKISVTLPLAKIQLKDLTNPEFKTSLN